MVGPTASGKTSLALQIAKDFKGEIVSADSRQLYRGTAICTDIPAGNWRQFKGRRRAYLVEGIPHYLLNSESPSQPITLSEYRRRAIWRLKEISARGKLPLLVGGTGLYIRAVVDNFDIPAVQPNLKLRASLERLTTAALFEKLSQLDAEYAARISSNNRRYAIRALEVIETTGQTFSGQQGIKEPVFDWLQIGVDRLREQLYERINARVDQMEEMGLLVETKRLASRYGWDAHIMTSLGYNQLQEFFAGRVTLDQALERMKTDTRHYARRQMTWLRRDQRIKWVDSTAKANLLITRFLTDKLVARTRQH
ncbi:MAG: tRNA (adenosine(37)-N6)-dimethylallyltransferase MiaA [Patescibacteria group bacterium]